MITEAESEELQYKVDEVSVIQKDLAEVEGKLKVVLLSDSERSNYQIPLMKRYRANLLVYLDDLNVEILEMRKNLGPDVEMTQDELENALSEDTGSESTETNLERTLFGKNDNPRTTERVEEEPGDIRGSGEGHSDQGLPSANEGFSEINAEEEEMLG